ncbi:hypothetical protein FB561_2960 [Kribbella amoyensis]|uniref:Uncharacterized protein n=1 Tax=Kribbella amoyensis TaxID=996641 RepID=A0A561BSL2_9ACTN|nr:hypothetical protein [Kribbella amoyensis]TWD81836.1 hypothetical protein FB561_2960 [Kribbella amoyensis]
MGDEPLIQRDIGDARAVFMIAPGEVDEASNLDLFLTLADGSRWSATVLTLADLEAIWKRWEVSGECLSGRYFHCPDLLLVREAGIDSICEVLEDILANGGPEGDLVRLDEDGGVG